MQRRLFLMFDFFKKAQKSDTKVDTLIGANTNFDGIIHGEGTLRIDGKVTGELVVAGSIIVGTESTIKGNIQSDNAYIAGTVEGNIISNTQLHLAPTAKVLGDIIIKTVVVDEGAVFVGSCKLISDNA